MQVDSKRRLAVEGSLTLQGAAGFKATLLRELAAGTAFTVDLDHVESIDISSAQLLAAAALSAASAGVAFDVRCGSDSLAARQLRAFGFAGGEGESWFGHKGDAV